MNREKLKRMSNAVRTGGKGTVRRKKKVLHRTNTNDDKRLQSTLKRLGVSPIPGIEEVNLFMHNTDVMQFINPKVQASIQANTYVVTGQAQCKNKSMNFLSCTAAIELSELLPGIITQMGPDSLASLKRMAEQMQIQHDPHESQAVEDEDDDVEVPELVGNFEEAAAET